MSCEDRNNDFTEKPAYRAGLTPFINFTDYSPVIPKFYYDVYSLEEREKHMSKTIAKLEGYSNYLAGKIGDLADEIGSIDINNPKRVIVVEDYGAVGDGKTDCTEAIQKAVYENPYARITFKGGVYLISDTIHLYMTQGATHFDLGGSTIKWNGCRDTWREGDTILYQDTEHPYTSTSPTVMIAADTQLPNNKTLWGNVGGRSIIENGCIDGQNKASILLMSLGYNANITKLRLTGAWYCGLLVGDLEGKNDKSMQNLISDVTINDYTNGSLWSQYYRHGMMITGHDNQIANCNIAFYKYQITCRTGGHQFSNIHTTVYYAKEPEGEYYGSNVLIWPFNNGTHEFIDFDNCYFNAGKCVFEARDSSGNDSTHNPTGGSRSAINMQVSCSNSQYVLYRVIHLPENTDLYIQAGAKMTLLLDNFGVLLTGAVARAGINMYDVYPNGKMTDTQVQLTKLDVKSLTFNNENFELINAHNLVQPNESRWVISGNTEYNGTYEIGKIVYQSAGGSAAVIAEPMEFEFRKYSGGTWKGIVYGTGSTDSHYRWDMEYSNTNSNADGYYLEKPHLENINGVDYWCSSILWDTRGQTQVARRTLTWRPSSGSIYARLYMNSCADNIKQVDSSRLENCVHLSNTEGA